MNKGVGNRRLLKLAAFLKKLPPKRFNYMRWVGDDWKGAEDLSCGTTACALGWAAAMPEFRRLGLRLKKSPWYGGFVTLAGSRSDDSIKAGEKVFGLSQEEALFLFNPRQRLDGKTAPGAKATPQRVAEHIETFVKDRRKAAR